MVYLSKMVIVHSYVSLLEGMVIVCYCVLLSRPKANPLELITVQSLRRVEIPNLLASILQLDHAKVGYIKLYKFLLFLEWIETPNWEHMFLQSAFYIFLQDEDTVLTWASWQLGLSQWTQVIASCWEISAWSRRSRRASRCSMANFLPALES